MLQRVAQYSLDVFFFFEEHTVCPRLPESPGSVHSRLLAPVPIFFSLRGEEEKGTNLESLLLFVAWLSLSFVPYVALASGLIVVCYY